jgi:hypothetical protein
MTAHAAPLPFRRRSLVEQAAQALRGALLDGTLSDPLPGEHTLSAQLGISRPTLRAALAILAREGLLAAARGRRTRLNRRRLRAGTRSGPPLVCIVSPQARSVILPDEHPVLLQLHARFAANGIAWEEVFDRKLAGPRPESRLRELSARHPRACWLMLASTAPMQRWFAQSGLPALVLGSCHADILLPSIDINYRAMGWHAAGVMLKHGHRRLALVLPSQLLAGDLACVKGVRAYLALASTPTKLIEINAGPDPRTLRLKLDRMLALTDRPTAIFCLMQSHALTTLLHLLEQGRRLPADVSLIARDLHSLMESAMPDLAHYSRPVIRVTSRALRLTQALLAGRSVPAQPSLINPVFLPGRTLAAPTPVETRK